MKTIHATNAYDYFQDAIVRWHERVVRLCENQINMNTELISIALSKYGLKEVPGTGDSPEIIQMAKDCGFADYVHDSIAWCSLFANWVAFKAQYDRSKALNARSWLHVGQSVTEPELGDIVVLWRDSPDSALGHVGFFVAARNGLVYLLAGNQGDSVCVEGFPQQRVLGYRRISKIV